MDESLDNSAEPQESGDTGEERFAAFLGKHMDDDGGLAIEEDQSDSSEQQEAESAPKPPTDKTDDATAEEPQYEVKVKGESKKVPLSELLAGYQKGEDYTQKTERLADERRQIEAVAQQVVQERQMYSQNIQSMQAQIAQAVRSGDIAPPDPALIESDPVEFLKQQQRYGQAQQMWQQLAQEQQQVAEKQRQEDEQRFSQTLSSQKEQLLAKLPHWNDKVKMQAEVADMKVFLKSEGYADKEVDSIVDARAVSLARKAMLYDKLMSNKQVAEQKVKAAPTKAIRSGTVVDAGSGPRINQSALASLRKTGSVDDAARFFRSVMG